MPYQQEIPRTAVCKHCGHNSANHYLSEPRKCMSRELRPPFPRIFKFKRDCRCPGFECDHNWLKAPFDPDTAVCANCKRRRPIEENEVIVGDFVANSTPNTIPIIPGNPNQRESR